MKIINNIGIVLISLYFLFLGAYYVVYAKMLYTATGFVPCTGTDCLTLGFLKVLTYALGFIGITYVILSIAIRFHRVGCYIALVACCFNILLLTFYLANPSMLSLWLTFVFPIRVIVSRSFEYSPLQAKDFLSTIESWLEILLVLLNILIAAYLALCLKKELWGPLEKKEKELSEEEITQAVKEYKERKNSEN